MKPNKEKPKHLSESLHSQCSEYSLRLVNEYSDALIIARKYVDTSIDGKHVAYQIQLLCDPIEPRKNNEPFLVWRLDDAEQADELIALLQRVRDDVFA